MVLVQAGEVRLEYFEAGSGDNVVVLIHGGGSSARIWHTVQRELAGAGIRSVAIGTRGAGGSDHTDKDDDYHPSNYARDLAAAVDEPDLPPFTLVGHSLGTLVAAYLVRDHRDRVRGLIQIAGPDPNRQPAERAATPDRARAGYGQSQDPAVLERWRSQHVGDADDVVSPSQPLNYYLTLPAEVRHLHVFHGIGHYPPAHVPDRLAGVMQRFIEDTVSKAAGA
jgi:pimeloyl-ACP methyl ester carboxylesterase